MSNKGKNIFGEDLSSKLVGDAGEYLVCAKLSRFGISAGLMKEGIANVDILATIDGTRTLSIQVKSSARYKNSAFVVKSKPKPSENLIFIFIEWKDENEPIYYIVQSKHISQIWKEKYINLSDISQFQGNWDLIINFFK
jgi:hypothetical protein